MRCCAAARTRATRPGFAVKLVFFITGLLQRGGGGVDSWKYRVERAAVL